MHRNLPEAYDDLKSAHYRFRPPRLSPDSKDEMDRVKNDKRSNKRAGKRQDHPDIGGSELRTPYVFQKDALHPADHRAEYFHRMPRCNSRQSHCISHWANFHLIGLTLTHKRILFHPCLIEYLLFHFEARQAALQDGFTPIISIL
jgi:hypothetical protein